TKEFNSSENPNWPVLRPKLTVTYTTATTVTLMQGQNGYAGTTDAKIACCSSADTNMGAAPVYELKGDTSNSSLVRFAIFACEGGPVPNGATITSATLSFYKYWGPATVFKVNRVLKNWSQSSVTWNTTGTGVSWTTPGVFSGDILATPDGQATVGDAQADVCTTPPGGPWPAACWLNIDVASGVQAFAGGASNFGWKLAYVSDAGGGTANINQTKEFNSSENPNWPLLRPKLTVTYTTATTVTLMQGQNGYAGTTDAKIACCSSADTNMGAAPVYELKGDTSNSSLVRFAIFACEGGPVPNGATITSATLSFYKYWGPATVFKVNRVLKNWSQSSVTWNTTGTGVSWTTPGVFSGDILDRKSVV